MSGPKVEVLIKGCHSTGGEGPHWDVASESLYTIDVLVGGIYRWDSRAGKEDRINVDGTISFAIPREKGGLVIGLRDTISAVDFDTKATQVLAEVKDTPAKIHFNDGKCDSLGRLWTGTMGFDPLPGNPEGAGNLYCLDTDLNLTMHDSNITVSNGLDWNDANTVFYYTDSTPRKIYAYDFDLTAGKISNKRTLMDVAASGLHGNPDGMCVDTDGKIWSALYGGSKVMRFDPETGKVLTTLDFPTNNITSCCFGGPHLDELFVTCGNFHLPPEFQEFGGSLFRVTGHGVKGRPSHKFRG